MSTDAAAPEEPSTTTIHESDLAGIRAATQWLLAAFGGTALVVVAGIQFADAWDVIKQADWRSWGTIAGLVLVSVGLFVLAGAAARVLVPDRTNLTDLLTQQAFDQAQTAGVVVSEVQQSTQASQRRRARRDSADVYKHVLDEISSARGWLLPEDCLDFDTAYQKFLGSTGGNREILRVRLREVAAFARAEAAFYRYRELQRRLLGWAGAMVFVGLIALVLACHAPTGSPVTKPTPVEVRFGPNGRILEGQGVASACAGLTTVGVAVGGSLSEPEVIIRETGECPRAKITVNDKVGLALPLAAWPE
jgi:hypothetical protein